MSNNELHRSLSARQVRMIALGGTIGVGLFMGATSTIKWTGPSVIFAYLIAGIFVLNYESNGRNDLFKSYYRIICNLCK